MSGWRLRARNLCSRPSWRFPVTRRRIWFSNRGFVPENLELPAKLHEGVGGAALLVGFVDRNEGRGKPFHNAAALLEKGKPIRKTYKSLLPTYDVFDEERYFQPASESSRSLLREKNRRNDLRRYLDGTLSAAAAIRFEPVRSLSSKARRSS